MYEHPEKYLYNINLARALYLHINTCHRDAQVQTFFFSNLGVFDRNISPQQNISDHLREREGGEEEGGPSAAVTLWSLVNVRTPAHKRHTKSRRRVVKDT